MSRCPSSRQHLELGAAGIWGISHFACLAANFRPSSFPPRVSKYEEICHSEIHRINLSIQSNKSRGRLDVLSENGGAMNRNNTHPLPIHITPHHLSLSPMLRDFAHDKLAKVPRFSNDALRMDLVLRRHGGAAETGRFSASARLALPGRDIHAAAAHADLYTAIVNLVSKLARHSRKRKARHARALKNLRRSARGNRPAMLREVPDAFMPVAEAEAPLREQTWSSRARKAFGLVERSSSSNPAHGIAFCTS